MDSTPLASGSSPMPPRSARLAALLHHLPPEHRAIVECLESDREDQVRVAERHAEALHRLQEASVSIARVLEREAIERELARHGARLAMATGGVVATGEVGADGDPVVTSHWSGSDFTEAAPPPGVLRAMREAGRTGRAVREPAEGGVIAMPIRASHRSDGLMAVYGLTHGDLFDLSGLLSTLAATGAASLASAGVVADSIRDRRQSEALADLARALGSSQRLGEVLHLGLRHSTSILGAEGADIALVRGEYLHIVAASGTAAPTQGVYMPIRDSITGRAMLEDRGVIVNSLGADSGANPVVRTLARVEKFASAPLRTPTGPIGMLSVVNRARDFNEDDLRVIDRLASQLAVAVVKVRLFEEAEEATRELRAAFDAIAGGMAVLDSEGFIVRHNARLGALAGKDDDASLRGYSIYEAVLGEPRNPAEDEPIGAAIIRRSVGRGTMRPVSGDRVFEVVASPHPQGGAVVTIDDVTSFLSLSERYRLVVESTTDAIVITDATGSITFANSASLALFGRDVAAGGVRLSSVTTDGGRAVLHDASTRALAGEAVQVDGLVLRPHGDVRLVSVSLAPVRNGSRITGLVASLRDSTAEAEAQAAMAAADTRYRNLFEAASDAIFTIDASGTITSANAACAKACGLPRDAIVGRRLTTLVDPADAGAVNGCIAAALGGRPVQFECSLPRADSSTRLMSISFSLVVEGPANAGLLGIARDVTDQRAQAAALERAESRYARLVESAQDGICTIDEEGRITSANRAFRRIVRLSREAIVGHHFGDLIPEDQRATVWAMYVATIAGARQRGEIRFLSHLGLPTVVSVSCAPLVEHDVVTGALAILRDVTEERALFERAARRDKLAALGELVGGVAHEVNSPLTGILAHGQLLQSDVPADSDARKAADTIVNEARRAARIVGKLLTFARQNPSERIPTDINQVIMDTLELRRYPLRMQEVDLTVTLANDLPAVSADPFQLQQVFINLLSNAEQSVVSNEHPVRRITVRSERKEHELRVSISDSGGGIAPEHLPHIFNPFYTTKPRGVGTGLGLSISFGIVREHGGFIQAFSPPGEGATFIVHLPLRDARTAPSPSRAD
jgi:PAS domain S-box-containing protein